jgi:hypothetical protein
MDVHGAIGGDRTLRRIIALLVALAALAERAAARSYPVRCLVLWILGRAEAVAGQLVFEATGTPPPAGEAVWRIRNGRAVAIRLAARFKALAAALGAWLAAACRFDCRPSWRGRTSGTMAPRPGQVLGAPTRKLYDTS